MAWHVTTSADNLSFSFFSFSACPGFLLGLDVVDIVRLAVLLCRPPMEAFSFLVYSSLTWVGYSWSRCFLSFRLRG
ncbi:hypothetical protein QBC43DRAFT_319947 [Cladorrhinum sp. PSN259]|nr:hypothetical protein QBC43DRAFT_319947 [Cladorrhinum sp. PSN259]